MAAGDRTPEAATIRGWCGSRVEGGVRVCSVRGCRRCVFFFQAEDGIRDATVTGVQTCALPILIRRPRDATVTGVQTCALPICTRLNSSHGSISYAVTGVQTCADRKSVG